MRNGDAPPTPPFADLPGGRADGVFGADDVLGCLNRLTPAHVRAAAGLVRDGVVFSLNAPVDWPSPPLFSRGAVQHEIFTTPLGNLDDRLDAFHPQASSQWDALCHVRDEAHGHYNRKPPHELGIEHMARRGIVGRGVVLDVARHCAAIGRALPWNERIVIDVDLLRDCISWADLEIGPGDIVMLRTGWVTGYCALDAAGRAALGGTRPETPGLAATDEMAAFLWDLGLAAIVADNPALEACPTRPESRLHPRLLSGLGMPIGEMWWLDELADACATDRRWDCLVMSAPLNVPRGVGSTANALAVR